MDQIGLGRVTPTPPPSPLILFSEEYERQFQSGEGLGQSMDQIGLGGVTPTPPPSPLILFSEEYERQFQSGVGLGQSKALFDLGGVTPTLPKSPPILLSEKSLKSTPECQQEGLLAPQEQHTLFSVYLFLRQHSPHTMKTAL